MTGNQISYQRFLEDQRHNLVSEANQVRQLNELERHNSVTESQGWSSILETARHNREGEALGWANYSESARHNRAQENYNMSYLNEVMRHNRVGEGIDWYRATTDYYKYQESVRHNLAEENLGYAKNPWAYLTDPDKMQSVVKAWTNALSPENTGTAWSYYGLDYDSLISIKRRAEIEQGYQSSSNNWWSSSGGESNHLTWDKIWKNFINIFGTSTYLD